jgi:cyclic beta-1,2-glucan synthetase
MDAPVKFVVVKLRNQSGRARRLSVTGYWELVLGEWRHANLMHVVTEVDPATGALFARNAYNREFAGKTVFRQRQRARADRHRQPHRVHRAQRHARPVRPRCGRRLSGRTGAASIPVRALQTRIELADGEEREIVFVWARPDTEEAPQQLVRRFGGRPARGRRWKRVWEFWNRTLGVVYAETPDPALNVLVNGWLEYQTLACRYWGRSGYYQSGGAYGFRDQLQDTMALLHAAPWLAASICCAAPGASSAKATCSTGGIRPPARACARISPTTTSGCRTPPAGTCAATGDTGVLDERAISRRPPGEPDEEAYYDLPQRSGRRHALRALRAGDRTRLRFGEHGCR